MTTAATDATPVSDRAAVDLLRALVAIPSVSGDERRAVDFFVSTAASLGLAASIDAAGNAVAIRRAQHAPPDDQPTLALLGHIDTVPGHIPVRIERGTLHGRGSVDAKGPLLALLLAAAGAEIPSGASIAVIGAVGEETPHSPGARFLRDRLRPRACIVGEPSGVDAVTLGYKGRLVVEATCERDEGHSAGADGSPSDALLEWRTSLAASLAPLNAGRDRLFDRIQSTVPRMDSFSDGLSARSSMRVGLRLPPWADPHDLERSIGAIPTPPGVSLLFEGHERAFGTRRDDPVVRALSRAISEQGARPRHVLKTGTSDMNVVAPVWMCPSAAYGPGQSVLDHTPHERLDLAEFLRALRTLECALSALTADLASSAPSQPAESPLLAPDSPTWG